MIAFLIQIHGNFDYAARLLGWIWRPRHSYVIGVNRDVEIPPAFVESLRHLENVILTHDVPVVWSGVSSIAAWLGAMRALLRNGRGWSWFVNITGADIPLKTPEYMADALHGFASNGLHDHVSAFDVTPRYVTFSANPTRGAAEMLAVRRDCRFIVHADAAAHFAETAVSPIIHPELRAGLHCVELAGHDAHYARPLYGFELEMRKAFFRRFPCRCGRGWVILSRATCEWLLAAPEAKEAYAVMQTFFSAEEMYFHTLLYAMPDKAEHINNNNLRFHKGHPETVTDAFLAELQADPSFFARKIEPGAAQAVLDWVESLCPPHPRFSGRNQIGLM